MPAPITVLLSGRVEDVPGYVVACLDEENVRGILVQIVDKNGEIRNCSFGEIQRHEFSLMGFALQFDALHGHQ